MRRKDREVTDVAKIADIIDKCMCIRVGFNDDGEVYIVPMNYGYEKKDDTYVFYFHGAREGRKYDVIQKNPEVGFEMDRNYALVEAKAACGHSALYQSIIGNGIVSMVTDLEEKKYGLSLLMEHNAGEREWSFDERMVNAVTVFKLEVTKISCKEHK